MIFLSDFGSLSYADPGEDIRQTSEVSWQDNKNASRFREAFCVLVNLLLLSLHQAQTPHGGPGGSSHGHHTETVLVHDWAVFYASVTNESSVI
jgi:hypothetical protein